MQKKVPPSGASSLTVELTKSDYMLMRALLVNSYKSYTKHCMERLCDILTFTLIFTALRTKWGLAVPEKQSCLHDT